MKLIQTDVMPTRGEFIVVYIAGGDLYSKKCRFDTRGRFQIYEEEFLSWRAEHPDNFTDSLYIVAIEE